MIAEKIFVYHLDAEIQKLYINHTRYNPNTVYGVFKSATRVAYLLSSKKICIPISNYFESKIAFSIINELSPLGEYGCIELLSKSETLDILLEKKKEQHGENIFNEQYNYTKYINRENDIFLPGSLVSRKNSASKSIKNDLLSSIGDNSNWRQLHEIMKSDIKYSQLEYKLAEIPKLLGGRAYISDYIIPFLDVEKRYSNVANRIINLFVTKAYIKSFLEEYDAVCLTDIPFINSKEILPEIDGKENISYQKYAIALQRSEYKGVPALKYIFSCSANELFEFKYSDLWKDICNDSKTEEKIYYLGENQMNIEDIRIGIITALPEEYTAIKVLLDNVSNHNVKTDKPSAGNRYVIGEIKSIYGGTHLVALCLLPEMGNNFSASIATKMLNEFPRIDNIIVSGIAGGVPSKVYLGDVVISTKGVLQYDFGKNEKDKFILKEPGSLCSAYLIDAIKHFRADILEKGEKWRENIDRIDELTFEDFSRPIDMEEEYYGEVDGEYVLRTRKSAINSSIFFERIASGNVVQKNPEVRDSLNIEHGIIAIEMEAAGIKDATRLESKGYLVIRGICDYCDDTKNDSWHNYAAAIAAAYTFSLIESMPIL